MHAMDPLPDRYESTDKYLAIIGNNVAPMLLLLLASAAFCLYYARRQERRRRTKMVDLLHSFQPEPLCSADDERNTDRPAVTRSVLAGKAGSRLVLLSSDQDTHPPPQPHLNLASSNFLNLLGNAHIESKSIDVVRKYGVGSCGPRGFYGTVDIHLELESRIADFMNMEEAIVYSYGFSTVASTIPAYCKPYDVIFCDTQISSAARNGILASRSRCIYFEHNDAEDLRRKLADYVGGKKRPNPKERRFLLLEGIYGCTGSVCNLPAMVRVRNDYQMRLFLDESNSIGVLGATGRGVMEHYGVNQCEVDLVIGSLETLVGSIGGFCVGSHFTIEHQRLSGLGYCFSASLPPVLAYAAIAAFNYMDENKPRLFEELRARSRQVHASLTALPSVTVFGDEMSPVKYLQLAGNHGQLSFGDYEAFVSKCRRHGLLLNLCTHGVSADSTLSCSVKLLVNVALTPDDITFALDVISSVSAEILKNSH